MMLSEQEWAQLAYDILHRNKRESAELLLAKHYTKEQLYERYKHVIVFGERINAAWPKKKLIAAAIIVEIKKLPAKE